MNSCKAFFTLKRSSGSVPWKKTTASAHTRTLQCVYDFPKKSVHLFSLLWAVMASVLNLVVGEGSLAGSHVRSSSTCNIQWLIMHCKHCGRQCCRQVLYCTGCPLAHSFCPVAHPHLYSNSLRCQEGPHNERLSHAWRSCHKQMVRFHIP